MKTEVRKRLKEWGKVVALGVHGGSWKAEGGCCAPDLCGQSGEILQDAFCALGSREHSAAVLTCAVRAGRARNMVKGKRLLEQQKLLRVKELRIGSIIFAG